MASQETREEAELEVALGGGLTKESEVCDVRTDDSGAITAINQYEIVKPLGKGSFAEVFLCADADNVEYAVKIFNKSLLRRKRTVERTSAGPIVHSELEKVQREIDIMKRLVHKNLVCLYEVIDDDEEDQLYMFMEYVEIGPVMTYDKSEHVFKSRVTSGVLDECTAAQYLLDIAAGLRFLHQNCIAHRDLKPDNVLLGIDGRCKIADFGVAHYFAKDRHKKAASAAALERSKSRAQMFETQGTYCFWAPEMVDVREHAFNAYACDMWAVGVCFYIFLSGECPFFSEAVTDLFDQIRAADFEVPEHFSEHAARVVTGLLRVDVDERLTVQDLEADAWLQKKRAAFVPPDLTPLSTSASKQKAAPRLIAAFQQKRGGASASASSSNGDAKSRGGRRRQQQRLDLDDDDDDDDAISRKSDDAKGLSRQRASDGSRRRRFSGFTFCKGLGRMFSSSSSTSSGASARKPRRQTSAT